MKIKFGVLSLTAASVFAFSTAFAADGGDTYTDLQKPAEPQDQMASSIGPGLNPPAPAETRELPPDQATPDRADAERDQATATLDSEGEANVQAQAGQDTGAVPVIIAPVEPDDEATGGGQAGGADMEAEPDAVTAGEAEEVQQSAAGVRQAPDLEEESDSASVGGGQAAGADMEAPHEAVTAGEAEEVQQSAVGVRQAPELEAEDDQAALDTEQESSATGAGQAGGMSTGQQYDRQTVERVQEALNDKGFHAGHTDGVIGPNTRKALRNFQQDEGLQASGELNQETLAALGVEAQAAGAGSAGGQSQTSNPTTPGWESSERNTMQEAQNAADATAPNPSAE